MSDARNDIHNLPVGWTTVGGFGAAGGKLKYAGGDPEFNASCGTAEDGDEYRLSDFSIAFFLIQC